MPNDLEKFFYNSDHFEAHKFLHYLEVYERHLARFRGTDVHVVEVGVGYGGSLQMWAKYFGPSAKIFGIDISERRWVDNDQIKTFCGHQGDRDFLRRMAKDIPRIDILIDDGSHEGPDQIATFEELFPVISESGIYACEDLEVNYSEGNRRPDSFVEYMKDYIDCLHNWRGKEGPIADLFSRDLVYGIHCYPYMFLIEKIKKWGWLCSPVRSGGKRP